MLRPGQQGQLATALKATSCLQLCTPKSQQPTALLSQSSLRGPDHPHRTKHLTPWVEAGAKLGPESVWMGDICAYALYLFFVCFILRQ